MSFPATHLSLIRRVGSGDADTRSRAQESLAAIYWPAIYAHIRLVHRQQAADAEGDCRGKTSEKHHARTRNKGAASGEQRQRGADAEKCQRSQQRAYRQRGSSLVT